MITLTLSYVHKNSGSARNSDSRLQTLDIRFLSPCNPCPFLLFSLWSEVYSLLLSKSQWVCLNINKIDRQRGGNKAIGQPESALSLILGFLFEIICNTSIIGIAH